MAFSGCPVPPRPGWPPGAGRASSATSPSGPALPSALVCLPPPSRPAAPRCSAVLSCAAITRSATLPCSAVPSPASSAEREPNRPPIPSPRRCWPGSISSPSQGRAPALSSFRSLAKVLPYPSVALTANRPPPALTLPSLGSGGLECGQANGRGCRKTQSALSRPRGARAGQSYASSAKYPTPAPRPAGCGSAS